MTNIFLQVNKDYFQLGLNPTGILLLAQIAEYNRTTGDFFMSDKVLAEQFGVSESTVKRELKKLEEEFGFITRETKNVRGGRERHIKININKIEEKLASVKMSLDECEKVELDDSQGSKCTLSSVKMNLVKGQIDTIKDNIINKNEEEKICGLDTSLASLGRVSIPYQSGQEEEEYPQVSKREMLAYGVPYQVVDETKSLYRIIATNKIVKAV